MMIVNGKNIMCENRDTELLLEEIVRMDPNIRFNILGDEMTEKEALLLYKSVLKNKGDEKNVIYVPVLTYRRIPFRGEVCA